MRWPDKDPQDSARYSVDWSSYVAGVDDSLSSAAWASTPAGLTLTPIEPVSANVAQCNISGGTAGVAYAVTCTATMASGQVIEQTITLKVRQQ